MITQALLDRALATTIGADPSVALTMIRADQLVARPARVYGTYKIIAERVEPQHQEIQVRSDGSGDPGMPLVTIKTYQKSRATVSINIWGDTAADLGTMRDKAAAILGYIRAHGFADLSIQQRGAEVQDRTSFEGPDYKYQLGFDLVVHFNQEITDTVEGIKTVEITPTLDDVVRAKILITAP